MTLTEVNSAVTFVWVCCASAYVGVEFVDQEIRLEISAWLAGFGIDSQPSDGISTSIMIIACLLLAGIAYFIVRRVVIRAVNMVILRSKVTWDDVFMRYKVLEKLAMLVPAIVLNLLVPIALTEHQILSNLVDRLLSIWLVVLMIRAIYAGLDAVDEISDVNLVSRRLPVKSFVQLTKLFYSLSVLSFLSQSWPISPLCTSSAA